MGGGGSSIGGGVSMGAEGSSAGKSRIGAGFGFGAGASSSNSPPNTTMSSSALTCGVPVSNARTAAPAINFFLTFIPLT